MKLIFGIFLVAVFSKITFQVESSDDYSDTSGDDCGRADNSVCSSLNQTIEENISSLKALFGTEHLVQTKVIEWIDDIPEYWKIEQALFNIKQALLEPRAQNLQASQVAAVQNVSQKLEKECHDLFKNQDEEFFTQIMQERKDLDCLLGRSNVNKQFSEIVKCANWYACSCLTPLWLELKKEFHNPHLNCNMKRALEVIIYFDNYYTGKNSTIHEEQIDFLYTITDPSHTKLLNSSAHCYDEECENEYICTQPSESVLNTLMNVLENNYSDMSIISSISEVNSLFEFQQQLASINERVVAKTGNAAKKATIGSTMLSAYVKLLDNAISDQSKVWKDVTNKEKSRELEKLLFTNEQFIGDTSDMFLDKINKTTYIKQTSLELGMVQVQENSGGQADFKFHDSQIWTSYSDKNSTSNVNVYAIHYKTWKKNLMSSNQTDNSFLENKTFVGAGGILSLSTRVDKKKKSVPVMYKINFSNDDKAVTKAESSQQQEINYRCLSCQFLDEETGSWMTTGCHIHQLDNDSITCNCNHTTNFAAFMSPFAPQYTTTRVQERWLNLMEYAGSSLTISSLIATLVIFFLVRKTVRSDRMKAHVNLSLALISLHFTQLSSDWALTNDIGCVIVTVLTHYFALSTFMWMFVEGIFLYLYVVQVFIHSRLDNKVWMYLTGWGFPLIVVGIAAGIGIPRDNYVQKREMTNYCDEGQLLYPSLVNDQKYAVCWLNSKSGMTWSFLVPALLIIFFNFVILMKVVQVLVKMSQRQSQMSTFKASENVGISRKSYSSGPSDRKISMVGQPTSIHNISSKTLDDDETLHGNNLQKTANIIHSRAASQCHSQNNLVDSPTTSNSSTFMADVKTGLKGAFVLLPLLGIPWLLGVFGYANYALTVIFVVCNSLQGLGIFLVYCIFNGEIQRALKRNSHQRRLSAGILSGGGRDRITSTSSNKSFFRSWRRRSTHVSTLPSTG